MAAGGREPGTKNSELGRAALASSRAGKLVNKHYQRHKNHLRELLKFRSIKVAYHRPIMFIYMAHTRRKVGWKIGRSGGNGKSGGNGRGSLWTAR